MGAAPIASFFGVLLSFLQLGPFSISPTSHCVAHEARIAHNPRKVTILRALVAFPPACSLDYGLDQAACFADWEWRVQLLSFDESEEFLADKVRAGLGEALVRLLPSLLPSLLLPHHFE